MKSASEFWANNPNNRYQECNETGNMSRSEVRSVLHRCEGSKGHRMCGNLQNRKMDLDGHYLTSDNTCKICGNTKGLRPVQSFIDGTRDVLVYNHSHPVLMINVNGEVTVDSSGRMRIKGKFVKGSELTYKETYSLHMQASKDRNPVEVLSLQ